MNDLTDQQAKTLSFMKRFFADNDQLPPLCAIACEFEYSSQNAAFCIVKALERKGYIERNQVGKYRFVRCML